MSNEQTLGSNYATRRLTVEPTVHPTAVVENAELGAYTEVGAMSFLENVTLGDYSYGGQFCFFQNVTIGAFANIAASVRIGPTAHPAERATQHHFTYRRRLYGFGQTDDEQFFAWRAAQRAQIGHDTWIGHGAVIMPKVTVGTGSIVGSGAVVTRDVPPYTVAVGVPAKVIKRRFDDAIAEALQEIAWWQWDHQTIGERVDDFAGPVQAFVEKYRKEAP